MRNELEPLITRCPNCGTRFRVTESQLAVAAGRVRCGACLTVFEGTEHLLIGEETVRREENPGAVLDELLDELDEPTEDEGSLGARAWPGGPADESPAAVSELDAAPQIYGGFEEDEGADGSEQALDEADAEGSAGAGDGHEWEAVAVGPAPSAEPGADDGVDEHADALPFAARTLDQVSAVVPDTAAQQHAAAVLEEEAPPQPEAPAPPTEVTDLPPAAISFAPEPRRWWVGAVAGVFVLALIVQVFYFQMPAWSRDPGLRPLYATACRWLSCELPAMRDVNRMSARNLVVRSHPELGGALIVDAVIVNDADYAQPFPDLELRFTAVGGLLVAGRRFAPGEYLVGEDVDLASMPPHTPVQVSLEIEDPGPDAVNYVLKFR